MDGGYKITGFRLSSWYITEITRTGDILAHYFRIFGQTVGRAGCNQFGKLFEDNPA